MSITSLQECEIVHENYGACRAISFGDARCRNPWMYEVWVFGVN